jgi:hypothetical protein
VSLKRIDFDEVFGKKFVRIISLTIDAGVYLFEFRKIIVLFL